SSLRSFTGLTRVLYWTRLKVEMLTLRPVASHRFIDSWGTRVVEECLSPMGNPSIPPRNLYHQFILTEPQKGRRIQSTIEQGRTLLENSQYDEARRLFLQTLSSCPYAIPALNNLAFISLRESDNTRALNIIDEVLRIDP